MYVPKDGEVINFIKKMILDLRNVDLQNVDLRNVDLQNVDLRSLKEDFKLPPFETLKGLKKLQLPEQLRQHYDINDNEIYDVISDFDKSPCELTNIQKQLRKKYLGIIVSHMNKDNHGITQNLKSMSTQTQVQIILSLALQLGLQLWVELDLDLKE